jgi:tetratricopeptide (TPR) repeat protein
MVDLEKGILLWSAEIPVNEKAIKTEIDAVAEKFTSSIAQERNASPDQKVSFWRILDKSSLNIDENLVIDKLIVNLMKANLFKIIDRSQLERLMAEVRNSKEGIIDKETTKELGQMCGIDLFLYGSFYDNTFGLEKNPSFILKMADLEKGTLVWAKEVPIRKDYIKTGIDEGIEKVTASLGKQGDNIKTVKTAAFLRFTDETGERGEDIFIDKLTSKMVSNFSFSLIDRSSLNLLIEESKKAKEGILDEKSVAELGRRYGVDCFIVGKSKKESEIAGNKVINRYNISAKMVEVSTGKIMAMAKEKTEEEIKEKQFVKERSAKEETGKKERSVKEKADKLTEEGINYYHKGNYKNAISFFEEVIKLGFVSQKTWLYLGLSFFQLKDEENGYRAIKKAVDMNPDSSLGKLAAEAIEPIPVVYNVNVEVDLGEYNRYSEEVKDGILKNAVTEFREVLDSSQMFKRVFEESQAELRLFLSCKVLFLYRKVSELRTSGPFIYMGDIVVSGKNLLKVHNQETGSSHFFSNSFDRVIFKLENEKVYMTQESIEREYFNKLIEKFFKEALPELADKIDKKFKRENESIIPYKVKVLPELQIR